MSTTDLPGPLLEQIYEVGERMRSALESEDVDSFYELVVDRGSLLDRLNRHSDAVARSEAWNQISARLREQHVVLTTIMAQQEARLQKTLNSLNRFKDAQRSYTGKSPRGSILRDHVRG